jgi:hypothetical protein
MKPLKVWKRLKTAQTGLKILLYCPESPSGAKPTNKPVPDSGTHDACDECPLPAVHRQQDYNYVMHSFCDACWAMHLEICGNNGSPYRV